MPRLATSKSPIPCNRSVINLSTSSASSRDHRRTGNTRVRRKNSSAQKALADVTLQRSDKLVQSLRDLNEQNWQLEENKTDLQEKNFKDSMHCKREQAIVDHQGGLYTG